MQIHHLRIYLGKVQVHEGQGEELQADGAAVQKPEKKGAQMIGPEGVPEVEGKKGGAQGGPEETEEEEDCLVAEFLVAVEEDEPKLGVDREEKQGVKGCVQCRKPNLD